MAAGRTKMAIKNSVWGLISKISTLILGFISRTVFIRYLGEVYLGVNGVYAELLTVLSFAELGFGTALNFALYKPVEENDEAKIKKLLYFYKTIYSIIAGVVAIVGLILIPFLPYILKGAEEMSLFDLRLYFVIFLSNTVISYFVSYKFSYLNALQKNYVSTNINTITNFITVVAQIIVMVLTKSFLAYLLIQTGLSIVSKFVIVAYLNRKYPIVKEKPTERMTKEEKAPIFKEVKALIIHKFAGVAVNSTDNIIIASMSSLGVVTVGLVSNYNLIISSVLGFVTFLFATTNSGFGNLVAASSAKHYERTFKETDFLGFWAYGFCSIAFFVLIPPFITLWIGEGFLVDTVSFLLIIIGNYLFGQTSLYYGVRAGKGNFTKDKWVSFVQALTNLVVSIVAARFLGLIGIYIGTVVSRIVVAILRPLLTYRFLFESSCKSYFISFIRYILYVAVAGAITYFATYFILTEITIWRFAISVVIVAILPNLLFLLFTFRSNEFKDVLARIKYLFKKEKKEENKTTEEIGEK